VKPLENNVFGKKVSDWGSGVVNQLALASKRNYACMPICLTLPDIGLALFHGHRHTRPSWTLVAIVTSQASEGFFYSQMQPGGKRRGLDPSIG
jgi:hypothetical protein